MLDGGVSRYAAVHARVRAMYSYLLTPQELTGLLQAASYDALIGQLRQTAYGPYLMKVQDKELTPRRAVYQIKSQMADAYDTVIKSAPENARPLLIQYYRSFEVDNLKAVLRGIISGATWERVRYVLFPLGEIAVIPAQAMVEAGSVEAAVKLLRGTPYYETLSHAMERYTAEQSLFPLEVALDLSYWRVLWNDIKQLSNQDRVQALKIAGSLVDMNNLMWAIRYREYYHLSEEELINYTLPFGYRVRDKDIRAIAAGADIPQVISRAYPSLSNVDSLFLEPREMLPQLEVQLQRQVMKDCRTAFIGYPFHIGIPLAYLVLKKMEIQDLTVLIEAKSSQVPVEGFRTYLLMEPALR